MGVAKLPLRKKSTAKDPPDHYLLNQPFSARTSLYNSLVCHKSQRLSLHLQQGSEVEESLMHKAPILSITLFSVSGFMS